MARAAARGAKGKGRKPAPPPAPEPELSSDSEELVMHGDDAESTDLESIEDAVYDIDGASGDDSEEEELEEDARYAACARRLSVNGAKLCRQFAGPAVRLGSGVSRVEARMFQVQTAPTPPLMPAPPHTC